MNVFKKSLEKIENFKRNKEIYLISVRPNIKSNKYYYVLRLKDIEKRNRQRNKGTRTHSWIYMYDDDIANALGVKHEQLQECLKCLGFKYILELGQYSLETDKNEKDIIESIHEYCMYTRNRNKLRRK